MISELVIHPGESFFSKADLLTRPLINLGMVAQRISRLKVGGATVNVPAPGVILILPAATNDVTALQVI